SAGCATDRVYRCKRAPCPWGIFSNRCNLTLRGNAANRVEKAENERYKEPPPHSASDLGVSASYEFTRSHRRDAADRSIASNPRWFRTPSAKSGLGTFCSAMAFIKSRTVWVNVCS